MDSLYGAFENLVFTKTRNWKFEEISFTGPMLNILFLIDGRNNVSEIASKLMMDYNSLLKTLERLVQYNLIERKPDSPEKKQEKPSKTLCFRGVQYKPQDRMKKN